MEVLTEARDEWMQAQNYFENVKGAGFSRLRHIQIRSCKKKIYVSDETGRISGIRNEQIFKEEIIN